MNAMLDMVNCSVMTTLTGGRIIPIYRTEYNGRKLAFYHSLLGGAAAVGLLEEMIAKGAKKILFFGSCGALNEQIAAGRYIVPTAAYRDEGTSYHYLPASDYIEIETADRLSKLFDELNIPHIKAKIWTTDAVYRETKNNFSARKNDGCIAVDMECASVMAVGKFRKVEVYQFVYTADCLSEDKWDTRILGKMPEDLTQRTAKIAFELASRV